MNLSDSWAAEVGGRVVRHHDHYRVRHGPLGDGCGINRNACVETYLFRDRIMSIGPTDVGAFSRVGPTSVVLLDTPMSDAPVIAM
jgi:hypothetical protein